jgi:hypothetical protein
MPLLFLLPLFCFSIYLGGLCPTFLDDDSAETITAGVTLGIQHPPGYALDALWVRVLSLLPMGGPCFRVNVGSAWLASLSVLLLFVCIRLSLGQILDRSKRGAKGLDLVCALAGSLLFAFSKTPWEKALGAKGGLYLLQQALLLGFFLAWLLHETQADVKNRDSTATPWHPAKTRWFLLALFLFAAGFSNHWETQVLFSPLLLLFFFKNEPVHEKTSGFPPSRIFLTAGAVSLVGISPLLYLPLRAHLHPVLDLGAPDNFSNFMDSFFRRYTAFRETSLFQTFRGYWTGAIPRDRLSEVLHLILKRQGSKIPEHLLGELKIPALLLAAWGFVFAWRAKAQRTLLFLSLPFTLLCLALWSTLFIPADGMSWYIDNFLLPANWIVAFLSALGLAALGLVLFSLPSAQGRRLQWLWLFLACAVIPLYLFSVNVRPLDQENQMCRYDYGANLLKSCPANTVFFAEADEDYFPLYYFQEVEKCRPDVRMIPSFTLFETWGVDQVERLHPELGLTAAGHPFPDHFARIIYASSEIVVKSRDVRPCAFSCLDGAFHRFYLSRNPSLPLRRSGIILELSRPVFADGPVPTLGGLRLRHTADCPSNDHPSLMAIWWIYKSLGLFTP